MISTHLGMKTVLVIEIDQFVWFRQMLVYRGTRLCRFHLFINIHVILWCVVKYCEMQFLIALAFSNFGGAVYGWR